MTEGSARELVPAGRHRVQPAGRDRVLWAQPLTRRYLTELPQGRKAARVGRLWRVRGGSFAFGEGGRGGARGALGGPRLGPGALSVGAYNLVSVSSLALYRRYRPESFAEVIGQEHVTAP